MPPRISDVGVLNMFQSAAKQEINRGTEQKLHAPCHQTRIIFWYQNFDQNFADATEDFRCSSFEHVSERCKTRNKSAEQNKSYMLHATTTRIIFWYQNFDQNFGKY